MIRKISDKLDNYLIAIFTFVLIVDPGDLIFRIKTPLFLGIFLAWILQKALKKETIRVNKDINLLIIVFIAIPFLGLISGVIRSSIEDYDFAIGFIKAFLIIILLFVIVDKQTPVFKYLNYNSLIIPVIIIPLYFILLYNPDSFKNIATYLADDKNAVIFSFRSYFGLPVVQLYYKTCPLLVFPATFFLSRYYLTKSKTQLVIFLLVAMTLILSGTRTNMLIIILITGFYVFRQMFIKRRFVLLTVIAVTLITTVVLLIANADDGIKDESSEIKAGHFESFKQLYANDPALLIWGQGLGSKYYSVGSDTKIVQSELTYIELVRVFGLPLTLVLIFILIYPLIYLYHDRYRTQKTDISLAYGAYLVIVASNPLLVSSTGLLAVISMYSYIVTPKHLKIN